MCGPIFSSPGAGVVGAGTADARPRSKAGIANKLPLVNKSRRVKPAVYCLNEFTNELTDISSPLVMLDYPASRPFDRRRIDCVPPRVTGLPIIRRKCVPVRACDAIQIVNHFSFTQRQLASESPIAAQPCPVHVGVPELAMLEPQCRDVRRCSDR